MEYDTHLIGQRIKEARKAKRYTQDYVSAQANRVRQCGAFRANTAFFMQHFRGQPQLYPSSRSFQGAGEQHWRYSAGTDSTAVTGCRDHLKNFCKKLQMI